MSAKNTMSIPSLTCGTIPVTVIDCCSHDDREPRLSYGEVVFRIKPSTRKAALCL